MITYKYKTIDPPGTTYSVAYSINAKGQIVGFYQDSSGQEHGFLDSGGTYTTIDPARIGSGPNAYSINNSGQIVGSYFGNGTEHGFHAIPKNGHEPDPRFDTDMGRSQFSQLVQVMASFSPPDSGSVSSPSSQTRDDVLGQTDHLASPH